MFNSTPAGFEFSIPGFGWTRPLNKYPNISIIDSGVSYDLDPYTSSLRVVGSCDMKDITPHDISHNFPSNFPARLELE
jgi:hypothetical protein